MSKATALLTGRNYVIPDDVIYALNDVAIHRMVFNSKAKISGLDEKGILSQIVSSTAVPTARS